MTTTASGDHAAAGSAWVDEVGAPLVVLFDFDGVLLRGAREPILVNATPKLCKQVEKALGRSVTRVEWH